MRCLSDWKTCCEHRFPRVRLQSALRLWEILGADRTGPGVGFDELATIPNPNRCMPIPSLATSPPDSFCADVDDCEGGLDTCKGVGLIGAGFFNSTSSAPHFSIRSASSFAAFSASSNEIVSAFLTTSFCGFFAPRTPVRLAPVDVAAFDDLNADEVVVLGAAGSVERVDRVVVPAFPLAGVPFPLAGEGVRPRTGGVAVRDGGGVGL
jgi:hypothetical protein